jgi:trehalose 6-phosphate synthase/phosphatase
MDSFSEPYTRQGDDIAIDQVRADIRILEARHNANDIPLSGRVIHVCHYLPITATLNSHPGVLSPPPTPPVHPADAEPDSPSPPSPAWTINPRYGHAAMISGIRSLTSTHEQLIIGWTGDIVSPTPGEHITPDSVSMEDRAKLEEALSTYQPKESDPDDERKTTYVPVWLDDKVAHGHYDGYCKQSESFLHLAGQQLTMS